MLGFVAPAHHAVGLRQTGKLHRERKDSTEDLACRRRRIGRICHRAAPHTRAGTRAGDRSEQIVQRVRHSRAQARDLHVGAQAARRARGGHSGCSSPNPTVGQETVIDRHESEASRKRQIPPCRSALGWGGKCDKQGHACNLQTCRSTNQRVTKDKVLTFSA